MPRNSIICSIITRVYGTRTSCLRPNEYIYGPRQLLSSQPAGEFIAWFIRRAIDGGVIELFGDGKQKRDFVYVDDVGGRPFCWRARVRQPRARSSTSAVNNN